MTKQDWYNSGILKGKASKILNDNNDYNNSIYLGGYTVEILFKLLLIIEGKEESELRIHLNASKGKRKEKIERYLEEEIYKYSMINPEFFDIIDITKFKYILNGENDLDKCKWSSELRYNPSVWLDKEFSQKIQLEIEVALKNLNKLKIEGYLK
ncbi:MAG: hypothetical protein ACRC5F_01835 [Cetobacterium sp.]